MATKVQFAVECDKGKEGVKCSGYEYETIKDVIEKTNGPLPCPVNEYVFLGSVKGNPDEVVINPNILLCKWLKPNSHVNTAKLSNKSIVPPLELAANTSDDLSDQTIFFLKPTRTHRSNIARIPREKCNRRDFCVSAVKGESLLEALQKDDRFLCPETWKLFRLFGEESKGKKNVNEPLRTKAHEVENVTFTVEYISRKRVSSTRSSEIVSKSATIPEMKKEKLEEGGLDHVSSESSHTSANECQLHQNILETAKSAAEKKLHVQLLSEGKRTSLATLVNKTFSKAVDQSKSAWLMEKLVRASKSVGRIHAEYGRIDGTCFLVTEDIILTNYHVYKDIIEDIAARQISTKVQVFFNHVLPNQKGDLGEVEVDIEDIVAQCPDEELDYIFLRLKNKYNNEQEMGLGNLISDVNLKNLTNEVVTIIGHPDKYSGEKRIDTDCRILSEYNWRSELLDRKLKLMIYDTFFTCKKEIMSDKWQKKIAYDSSFFHGASGSPVFDDQGKIIAMHTCGWVEETAETSFSVMEFAVPMEAIHNHCFANYQEVAKMLFPRFTSLPMDIDQ